MALPRMFLRDCTPRIDAPLLCLQALQEMDLEPGEMSPEDWLRLADQTGIPLRVLWPMVNDWQGSTEAAV